jgi:hypothetical protein
MEDNIQYKLRFVRMVGHVVWVDKRAEHIHEIDE